MDAIPVAISLCLSLSQNSVRYYGSVLSMSSCNMWLNFTDLNRDLTLLCASLIESQNGCCRDCNHPEQAAAINAALFRPKCVLRISAADLHSSQQAPDIDISILNGRCQSVAVVCPGMPNTVKAKPSTYQHQAPLRFLLAKALLALCG